MGFYCPYGVLLNQKYKTWNSSNALKFQGHIYMSDFCSYELHSFQSNEIFIMHNTIFCDILL